MDFSLVLGSILEGFWLPFVSHLRAKIASRTHPGCSWGTGCLPKGAQEPSEPPKAQKIDPEGSQSSQNGALETPRAPKMSPWAVTGLPKRPLGATPTLASDPRLAEDPEVPKIDPK